MELIDAHKKLGARLWARPKRVAFLVDDTFTAGDINNVVRYCCRYLGGRSNPIVPIEGDKLGKGWEDVLRAVDADIFYSFKALPDKLKGELEREFRPTRFIEGHETHRHDHGWQISESEIRGTSLADVNLPFQPEFYGTPSVVQITIDDVTHGTDDSFNFCVRNFGAFSERNWKTFDLEAKGLKIIPVASIGEPHEFLGAMLPSAGKIFPINISSVGYERSPLVRRAGDEAQVYEIVIGDSVRDFLYVWNRSITTNFNWRKRALWVPVSSLTSEPMIAACASWVRDCVFHEGDVECKVLSYTVAEADLQAFRDKLQPQVHRRTSHAVLKADEACRISSGSIWRCATKGSRFEFGASDRVYGAPYPESLPPGKHGPQGWIVEIEFDRPRDGLGVGFKAGDWHLPKRHRLDKKFIDNQQASRITARGHLAVEVIGDKQDFSIKIPTVKELCDVLMVEVRSIRSGDSETIKTGEFRRIDTSSDGQYFWSILNLFVGLERGSNFLEDKGWRNVLFDLIGKRNLEEEVDGLLSDFIQGQQGSTDTESHAKTKAKRELVKKLVNMPAESRYVHFNHIVRLLSEGDSMLVDEDNELVRRQLHAYLSRNIFIQGSPVRCYNCGSQRWHRVDDLKTTMTCQGCASDFSLPPIESMTYRLNDLVLNGFRRYGFLPVFQALFALQRSARKHLLFLPQQNLYNWNSDEQVTDLDLVGILDGRYFIGEVKTGDRGLLSIDTEELVRISLELRPHLLLIAAPTGAFTKNVEGHLAPLFKKLKDTAIKAHVMRLSWPDVAISLGFVPPGTDED